ncbi:PPA1309 family protein [Gordonia paraffinivorans]|uniref:PPA1309 family protein n=1 Tax=Gordonia paraffinivorans TaxID=175628 RepID=UPI00144606DC|nr:PPA1309 family protein [Gordonia paraffinivorans]
MPADSTTPGPTPTNPWSTEDLGTALSEILDHVDDAGWGQAASVYALVPTSVIAEQTPHLVDDSPSVFTPVEQECPDLDEFLASAVWPDAVAGAAVALEIVVAEPGPDDDGTPRHVSPGAAGPSTDGQQARLVVGVLRNGRDLALMRLRRQEGDEPETLTHPKLATELREALAGTFEPDEPGT